MLDCISVENMRLSDAQTIAQWVPSLELMQRAAEGVFQAVAWKGNVAIMAGSGNNGGDGFALACILREHQVECTVFTLSQRLSQDSAFYARKAEAAEIPIRPFLPGQGCLEGFDMIVDCLLGTGFQGGLRENYRSAIEEINAADSYVVSVDINSGMNGDTGDADAAVCSDMTVTIGYVKNGLITENAGAHMKQLVCADIGIRLAREENKICDRLEWENLCSSNGIPVTSNQFTLANMTYFRCPAWLDIMPIKAYT